MHDPMQRSDFVFFIFCCLVSLIGVIWPRIMLTLCDWWFERNSFKNIAADLEEIEKNRFVDSIIVFFSKNKELVMRIYSFIFFVIFLLVAIALLTTNHFGKV